MVCQSKQSKKNQRFNCQVVPPSKPMETEFRKQIHKVATLSKLLLLLQNIVPNSIMQKLKPNVTHSHQNNAEISRENVKIEVKTPPKRAKIVTSLNEEKLSYLMKRYFMAEKGKSHLRHILYPAPHQKLASTQQCFVYYIASMSSVLSRMDSYRNWSSPVPASKLVSAGFFCDDRESLRVKCFSCELTLKVAQLNGEDPLNYHKRKSPFCTFISEINSQHDVTTDCGTPGAAECRQSQAAGFSQMDGHVANALSTMDSTTSYSQKTSQATLTQTHQSSNNINGGSVTRPYQVRNPQQADINVRKASFNNWPNTQYTDTEALALAGFFFTDTDDIVRCHCCDIGLAEWTTNDDPWLEHARHSPECNYLRQLKGEEYVNNVQREWQQVYRPRHKHMEKIQNRLASFTNWPQHSVTQTPRDLAMAGFFYTGEGDTVRCHYCDGGIREWEPNDDVWTEHAHWFPFCKYVLRVKGSEFIQEALARNDDDDDDTPVANIPPAFANQPRDENNTSHTSYEEECIKREKKNPLYSAAAESLFSMDYSRKTVAMAINYYIAETGRRDFKATDLMNIVYDMEDRNELMDIDESDTYQPTTAAGMVGGTIEGDDVEEFILTPAALAKETERLTYLHTCVKCKTSERQIVYTPCGHRVTCQKCSETEEHCSQCKVRITNKIKTYFG